jgi:predicted MFS family arabinose efflux permease
MQRLHDQREGRRRLSPGSRRTSGTSLPARESAAPRECAPSLGLAASTLLLLLAGPSLWVTGVTMAVWGTINSAIPVTWSNWLASGIGDEPEAGGGLMVAVIQLSIMLGAAFGGFLLDHVSIAGTFGGGRGVAGAGVAGGRKWHAPAGPRCRGVGATL